MDDVQFVHVYRVTEEFVVGVPASLSEEQGRSMALEMVKAGKVKARAPEFEFLAVTPEPEKKI